jgi:hypothetical protein
MQMRTGLIPIIRNLNGWLTEHYDSGFDPVDDESAYIRTRALLILDQLELLRALVQKHQLEGVDDI